MSEAPGRLERMLSFLHPTWAKRMAHLVRFGACSFLATVIDFALYQMLHGRFGLTISVAHLISAGVGMLTNFFLQRFFVFRLGRQVWMAFALSIMVSLGGLGLGYLMMLGLESVAWFEHNKIVAKMIVTSLLFGYNLYLKRYAFEGRFTSGEVVTGEN
jgi:putative flippase GtrA